MPADPAGTIYGEALFEAAQAAGRLKEVRADLGELGLQLSSSQQLVAVIFNPAFPEPGKRQVLAKLSQGADPLVTSTLLVLLDRGRLTALPDVITAFDELAGRATRQLEVELTTAIPIDDAQAKGLEARLTEATGQSVDLTRKVDPAILGGSVLRVRDLLIDASVRGRLEGLRLSLRKARLSGDAL
jgi:F-type H+-transporting ATPase subunit delta